MSAGDLGKRKTPYQIGPQDPENIVFPTKTEFANALDFETLFLLVLSVSIPQENGL